MTFGNLLLKPFRLIFGLCTLPFLVTGPYFIFQGLPHEATLKCDRVQSVWVKCTTTDKVLGWEIQEQSLNRLESVRVNEINLETGQLYQLILITRDTEIPFGLITSQQEKIQATASRLNTFIKNSTQPTQVIEQRQTQWNGLIVGSGFIALSVFILRLSAS
jgi:hypothetical protein